MHRKARSLSLPLSLGLILSIPLIGCTQNGGTTGGGTGGKSSASGGSNSGGSNSGGSNSGGSNSGGSSAKGGSAAGGSSSGGSNSGGSNSGGSNSGGSNSGGSNSGGSNSGGSNSGGSNSGGSNSGGSSAKGGSNSGGSNSGGSSSGGSSSGGSNSGGSNNGGSPAGGTGAGGTSNSGGSSGCTPGPNVLSDFESGKGSLFPVPSSNTTGFWYSYKDTTTCASAAQVPVAVTDSAVVAADVSGAGGPHDSGNACNKYAMHSSISGCQTYSGFGAALHPVLGGTIRNAVDLSAYDGLSFWIKAGTGTQGPLYLEFNSKECIPAVRGGVAVSPAIDQDNCHGKLLTSIPTTWTQMYVPFGTTGARWFPTAGASGSGKSCASGDFCEAPALNPANMLSFQFALEDPFNQKPALASSYDVWVDDVAFYKFSDTPKDAGLKTWTQSGTNSFPQDKTFTGCTKPTGATGKLIQDAYVNWKAKFVVASGNGMKVVSPEIDSGATVSEGMGYGMLMAVYMGDKALFDGLLAYWKSNASGQSMLMTWKIPGGSGSASDADEDTAFALQMAVKQWGSSYATDASTILSQFLANDVDGNNYLKPGNTFGGQNLTNPSYFAPAFYRYFASVDTGNASKWNALVANTYTQLGNISGSNGLVPAWCTANCMTRGSGGLNYADELTYQYDAHRTPWRIGLDVCWNGASTASAGKSYLDKVVGFFAGASNTAGISSLADIYSAGGAPTAATGGTIVYNSMSLDGCAGVGAMGSSAANAASFRDRVWKFLLAGQYSDNPTFKVGDSATKPGYTYYNATVGLITLMTMSGNFYPM